MLRVKNVSSSAGTGVEWNQVGREEENKEASRGRNVVELTIRAKTGMERYFYDP